MTKTSYGEQLCRELAKKWFPNKNVLYNYRPIWLKNPKTGRNLELDIFYPDLKLAIEFNGSQHNFLLQRRKDYIKKFQCKKIGILLLSVYMPMDLFKCKTFIKRHTGIVLATGRSMGEDFLWKLKMYSVDESKNTPWYIEQKELSEEAEKMRDQKKKLRRARKLEERRRLKRIEKGLVR